jgi:hypothetical protein
MVAVGCNPSVGENFIGRFLITPVLAITNMPRNRILSCDLFCTHQHTLFFAAIPLFFDFIQ